MTTLLWGKVSWFGGPYDEGVSADEGLAFIYQVSDAPWLFLPEQPQGTTGLARRLDPSIHYIACRWDYDQTPKSMLPGMVVQVHAPKTGRYFKAFPADWGPHESTGRIADISPGLMEALGITTDDEVEVYFPFPKPEVKPVPYQSIVISSGHGKYVRGASGVLDEVDEARKVVDRLADELDARGVEVTIFHDDTSHSQDENLATIVNFHNSETRELDVSVHFNAFEQTSNPRGCEVFYVTQSTLAGQVSAAIAKCGFINRGGKYSDDLYFLNNTKKPALLLEICFVDSTADAEIYREHFERICDDIANVLGGPVETEEVPPPVIVPPPAIPRVDLQISGDVIVTINGVVVAP